MKHCFGPARILLPAEDIPLEQWACLACDQFTSQPEYWQQAQQVVGDAPSTLRLILPEVWLGAPDEKDRIAAVHAAMREYQKSVLSQAIDGFVYLERRTESGVRQGLVGAVDLEAYSYLPGERLPVRPTEQTVAERIPPRLAVRRGAALETPHAMLLIDDELSPVMAPLAEKKAQLRRVYGGQLMLGGGELEGWAIEDPALVAQLVGAIAALGSQAAFDARWPQAKGNPPLTLLVGDGNHSIATAKAYWEELKPTLPPEARENHPARFCLAEVCSLHSPAILIEPIHRVLFSGDAEKGMERAALLDALAAYAEEGGAGLRVGADAEGCPQTLRLICGGEEGLLGFASPKEPLTVGTIEEFVQQYIQKHPGARVDYIHGEAACRALAAKGAAALLLPPFSKSEIIRGVLLGGVLPRKTFSMGHAEEKRYYMECRSIAG